MARPRGTDGARVITAIETRSCRGEGTEKDPCRVVIQYWDFEGNLLAENDTWKGWKNEELSEISTIDLINELEKRKGVIKSQAGLYKKYSLLEKYGDDFSSRTPEGWRDVEVDLILVIKTMKDLNEGGQA